MNLFPKLLLVPLILIAVLIGITGVSFFVNERMTRDWLQQPPTPGKIVELSNCSIYATVRGTGQPLAILSSLGTLSLEYEVLAKKLSDRFSVLTYDRSGYAWSSGRSEPNVKMRAVEFAELATKVWGEIPKNSLTLIAQGYGSLVAKEFASQHPELVKAIVYIDPLVRPEQLSYLSVPQKDSFVFDLSKTLFRATWVARLGLFRFLNMTPYDVPEELRPHVLSNISYPSTAKTVLEEYQKAQVSLTDGETKSLAKIPARLIVHSKIANVRLLTEYGVELSWAEKIETGLRDEQLKFVQPHGVSSLTESKKAIFSTHLDEPEIIINSLNEMIN